MLILGEGHPIGVIRDFPETASGWLDLGRAAGFERREQPFVAPTDLYRMFHFQG